MTTYFDDVDLERDAALVERFQSGDDTAFTELYRRYFERLKRFCRQRVHDDHAAEELAQEALWRAYRNLDRLSGERRFYPWLTVIASRLCVDQHRRDARTQVTTDIEMGAGDDPLDAVSAREERDLVRAAMAGISDRHRVVLDLREAHGFSYDAIAQELAIRPTAVPTLLHRARESLRRQYLATAGGGLASLPGFAYVRRLVAGLRTRGDDALCQGPTLIQAAQVCLPLALAVATVVAVVEPEVRSSVVEAGVVVSAAGDDAGLDAEKPAPDPGDPSGPDLGVERTFASEVSTDPRGGGSAQPASDEAGDERPPALVTGPAHVGAGPRAATAAGQRGSEMPLSAAVGPAGLGADLDAVVTDVSDVVLEPVVRVLTGKPIDRSTR